MFRSDLHKLSVTLVLLVATAFVSVAAVAAEGSATIGLVKGASASPALGGTADDWYGQGRSPANASGAVVVSDWFERHPDAIIPSDSATDKWAPLDWYFAHDHAVLDGDNNVVSSGKSLMDNQLAPLDWYFAHDHAVLDGDNNVVSYGKGLLY